MYNDNIFPSNYKKLYYPRFIYKFGSFNEHPGITLCIVYILKLLNYVLINRMSVML